MGMQVNRPVFNQGLVRNDRAGQAALKTDAPASDQVIDLSQTQNIQTELNTKQAQFLRVKAEGKDVFLDISRMSSEDKQALIAQLKNRVGAAQSLNQFNPETFFKLSSSNQLSFGAPATSGPTAAIQSSEAVLAASLKRPAETEPGQIFSLMNGSENALDKKDAKQHVGDLNKPAPWYNGFQVSTHADGTPTVSTYVSPLDTRGDAYDLNTQGYKGKKGIEAYQAMLKDDFNFNGAVTAVYDATGQALKLPPRANWTSAQWQQVKAESEKTFTQSVMQRFAPQHPNLTEAQLTTLSQNIWAYATTGADKNGRVDIGEMQAMLAQIDPEIVSSGSNNNASKYGTFTMSDASGKKFTLPKGDPYHGRGTILQTRHLLESFKPQGPVKLGFATPPPELQGYSQTVLLADKSSSMGLHMQHLSGVVKAGGIEGQVTVGTFIDKDKTMTWSNASGNESPNAVPLSAAKAQTLLEEQGAAHVSYSKDFNAAHPSEAAKPGSAFIYGKESMRESGILAGITALENAPDKQGSGPNTNQLVLFTDETDASTPADLTRLQALAAQKGYDVKVIFSRRNNASDASDDSFQILQLNTITASQSTGARTTEATTTAGNGAGSLDWAKIAEMQRAQVYLWNRSGL